MDNSKQQQHLFVYGTLAPDQPNAHILTPLNGIWQPAFIRGQLYPNGIGATRGFPAVLPNQAGEIVTGQIFSSDELAEHWHRIDEFEREGYMRVKIPVTLETGENLTAFVYALDAKELDNIL